MSQAQDAKALNVGRFKVIWGLGFRAEGLGLRVSRSIFWGPPISYGTLEQRTPKRDPTLEKCPYRILQSLRAPEGPGAST